MVYGSRVKQAREICGLTQQQLAEAVGINQSAIAQIETNRTSPSTQNLEAIAEWTGFLPSFFEIEPLDNFPLGSLCFRARNSIPAREEAQAHQYGKLIYEQMRIMSQRMKIVANKLPNLDEKPARAARVVRATLGLAPDAPIKNLIQALEKNGILVFRLPLMLARLDAFSTWVEVDGARPMVAICSGKTGDRLRFSTSHEIGHLVVHRNVASRLKEAEHVADQFAAEFLLPEVAMRQELAPPINLIRVAKLKIRWGVSMQSLIRRAQYLNIITERQYHYLFSQMSARGWKTREPANLDVPVEIPKTVRSMAEQLYKDMDDYARTMHLSSRRALEVVLLA